MHLYSGIWFLSEEQCRTKVISHSRVVLLEYPGEEEGNQYSTRSLSKKTIRLMFEYIGR